MTNRDIQIDNEHGGFFLYDANEPDTAPALARRIPTEADAKRFAAVDQLLDVARRVAALDAWQQVPPELIEQAEQAVKAAAK
jgi:hypothetical protein